MLIPYVEFVERSKPKPSTHRKTSSGFGRICFAHRRYQRSFSELVDRLLAVADSMLLNVMQNRRFPVLKVPLDKFEHLPERRQSR